MIPKLSFFSFLFFLTEHNTILLSLPILVRDPLQSGRVNLHSILLGVTLQVLFNELWCNADDMLA